MLAQRDHQFRMEQVQSQKSASQRSDVFFWVVASLVVGAITYLTYINKIEGQTVGTLFGAIVGYLFGRLKNSK